MRSKNLRNRLPLITFTILLILYLLSISPIDETFADCGLLGCWGVFDIILVLLFAPILPILSIFPGTSNLFSGAPAIINQTIIFFIPTSIYMLLSYFIGLYFDKKTAKRS